jgi:hypothetical protein
MRVVAVGLALAVALLVVGGTARAVEAVPMGRVCFQNPQGLASKLQTLIEKFVPGQGQQVAMGAQMMMNNGPLKGVDWNKPFTIAFFSGKVFGKNEPVVVGLCSLADPAAFTAALQAQNQMGGPKFGEARGNVAMFTDTDGALAAITEKRLGLYTAYPKIAEGTDVYFTFYIARTLAEYQEDINAGLAEMEAGLANLPPQMAIMGTWLKLMKPMAEFGQKQFHRVSLMGLLAEDNIQMHGRLYPVPDSEMAAAFTGQPETLSALPGYLPDNLSMGASMNTDIQKLRPLVDAFVGIVAPVMEIDTDELVDLIYASTQTGETAFGLAGDPLHRGVVVAQVNKIGDAAKYREAAKSVTEKMMQGGIGKLMNAAGMKVTVDHKAGAREHNGVQVDQLTVTFAQAEGAPPNPAMAQMQPQVTEMAAAGTLGFATTNNQAGDLLNAMLDKANAGAPGASKDFANAQAGVPQGTSMVMFVKLSTFLSKAIEEAAKQQPAAMMLAGLFKPDPNELPITANMQFTNSRMHFAVHVPHQPLVDLATRARMMMGGMGARPGGPPAPPPRRGEDF